MPTKKLTGIPQDPPTSASTEATAGRPDREDSPAEGGEKGTSRKISLVRETMRLGLDLSALRLDQFAPTSAPAGATAGRSKDGEHIGTNGAPLGTEEIRRKALETLHLLDEYNRMKLAPSKASLGKQGDLFEGIESLDDFISALDTSPASASGLRRAGKEKGGEKKTEPTEKFRREELADRISELLSEPQVYQLLRQSLTKETERFVAVQPLLSRLHKLRQVQDIAFERIHTLSLESKRTYGKIVGSVQTAIEKLSRLSREADEEENRVEEEASPLQKGWIASQRLLEYKQQLKKDRFVMTPSRREIYEEAFATGSANPWMVFMGSNGTGKTWLAERVLKEISGGHHFLGGVEGLNSPKIWGWKRIRKDNGSIVTDVRPGPVTRALLNDGGKAGLLFDEANMVHMGQLNEFKGLLAKGRGQEVSIPEFDERRTIPQNFLSIWTMNPNDDRVKDRQELDAGLLRELAQVKVPFMPQNEQEQIILAKLIDENGVLHLSKSEAQTIRELVAAAVMTQQCFDRAFENMDDDILEKIKGLTGIREIPRLALTKKFLDPGRLMEMFDTYEQKRAEGMSVADYLSAELKKFLAEFEVEEERNIAIAILKLRGVIPADSTATEPHVQVLKKPGEKPYLLPSELAFVISCDDELDDSDIEFDQPEVSVDDVLATDCAELLELLNQGSQGAIRTKTRKGIAEALGTSRKTIDRARQIMLETCGEDHFYGLSELKKTFLGMKIYLKDVPALPSETEIQRLAALGLTLRLRVSKAPDGSKLTMQKMYQLLQDEFTKSKDGKVLFSTEDEWKLKSTFFTDEVPELAWGFTSDEVLPNSTRKNHLQQTQLMAEYAKSTLFKGEQMPLEYREAIAELTAEQNEIQQLMSSDWKAAADRLANLKINKLMRATPVETLFDLLVTFRNSDPKKRKRLLEKKKTWTATQSSDGDLVSVGYFAPGGVDVSYWRPRYSDDDLGVVLARKFPRTLRT